MSCVATGEGDDKCLIFIRPGFIKPDTYALIGEPSTTNEPTVKTYVGQGYLGN